MSTSVVDVVGYLGAFTTSANTHFSGGSIRRYASNKRLIARDSSSQQSLSLEPPAVVWTIKGIGPIKCILDWTVVSTPLYAYVCVPLSSLSHSPSFSRFLFIVLYPTSLLRLCVIRLFFLFDCLLLLHAVLVETKI